VEWERLLTSRTIEELEAKIREAQIESNKVSLPKFIHGLIELSGHYANAIYEGLGQQGVVRDEIEGTGREPGFGHHIWAMALMMTAWTAWLFPDKALNRVGSELSADYSALVKESVERALEAGRQYVGQQREPLA